MFELLSKIVFFLWNMFAPERAREEMQKILQDFTNILVWMILLSFVFGAGFFACTYFLGLWLASYIPLTFVCYFIAAVVSLFFTLSIAGVVFRYLIGGFFDRLHQKGDDILSAFTPLRKHDDTTRATDS